MPRGFAGGRQKQSRVLSYREANGHKRKDVCRDGIAQRQEHGSAKEPADTFKPSPATRTGSRRSLMLAKLVQPDVKRRLLSTGMQSRAERDKTHLQLDA